MGDPTSMRRTVDCRLRGRRAGRSRSRVESRPGHRRQQCRSRPTRRAGHALESWGDVEDDDAGDVIVAVEAQVFEDLDSAGRPSDQDDAGKLQCCNQRPQIARVLLVVVPVRGLGAAALRSGVVAESAIVRRVGECASWCAKTSHDMVQPGTKITVVLPRPAVR
ncbi:MAG: hypothetical protein QOE30_1682 [Mycobacterium sp.]|jgi:hypothetical protein|nr:hypothetical protein [Mycobacterium sp.]